MEVKHFKQLKKHEGHNVEVVTYQDREGDTTVNTSIECLDCNTVLKSIDNPDL